MIQLKLLLVAAQCAADQRDDVGPPLGGLMCGKLPCLPGIDQMGKGFDILTGSSSGLLPVLAFTYASTANATVYMNPFNSSLKYAVPTEAHVQDNTHGESTVASKTFFKSTDFAAYLGAKASIGISGVPDNAFGGSVEVEAAASYLSNTSSYGSFSESNLEVKLYDIDTDPLMKSTETFQKYVSILPATYDKDAYQM